MAKKYKIAALPKAQLGISDPAEYKYRKKMYDDSLALYKENAKWQPARDKALKEQMDWTISRGTVKKSDIDKIVVDNKSKKIKLPESYKDALQNRIHEANQWNTINKKIKPTHIGRTYAANKKGEVVTDQYGMPLVFEYPVYKKPVQEVTFKKEPDLPVLKTLPVKPVDTNREEPKVIPVEATNANRDNSIVPPQSVKQWKQNPATGTWYQIERPVNPMYSPKYNPGTGSYQGGGEKNDYIEIDADDTEIGDLIAQGYVVEQLPMAQDGYITASPISYHGDTPGLYRFDTQNPTFNVGYTQPLGSRAVNRLGVDAMSAGLTAKLPYMNNTGMGIQGNLHTDFDEWHNFPARMETDLSLGYDPKLGFHSGLIASPQFTFGNVQPTNSKVYGTGLKSGEFIANVGPFAGASAVPGRKTVEERFSMPAGVKGNIDFGIGRKGIKAGLSGYAGADLMGSGLESKSSESGLKPKFNYGIQANLKLPIKSTKEYFKDLLTQKEKQDRDYTPKIQNGGLIQAQKGGTYYTYPGSEGVYRKVGNKWEVDWNKSGNFQPLSKGNIKEREAALNKGAQQLFDRDYSDLVRTKQQKFESAPKPTLAKKPTPKQTAAQKAFDKDFKVTGKSKYEEVEDLIQRDINDAKKISKERGIPFTKADEDSITGEGWNRYGHVYSGTRVLIDPGVIRTPSKSTVYFNAPENPTIGDYAGKAWDIITNPIDYFNYSVATGDMMNAPWDITDYERALDKLGAEDPILSRNEVGKGLNFATYFNPVTGTMQAIKSAAEIPGLTNRAMQTGDWSDAGWAIGETALELIPGIGAIDDVAGLAKTLPVQTRSYKGLPLREIRMNEIVRGRNFGPSQDGLTSPLRAESIYDLGDLNVELGTPAGNAYETMRLNALGVEGPPAPNIRTKPHRWRDIDKTDIELSKYPKEELDAFGLGQGEIPFTELKGERPLTDPNYLENLKAAKDRALKNGDEDLAKIYSDLIEKSKVTDLGRFTEAYTGSDAIKELGKERLNMFEPTPGEEYAMLTKDLDPTNTKKEVYQTISDAIEDTRANKIEKWQTDEGKRRLQNMIDTTPYLKELGMTPESYVDSLVNLENANKTYLEKLMDVDEINEKILNLDKQYDLGNIEEQAYWNQIMDLESQVLSKRNEIADIRGDINRSGKYNAFMEATNRIAIGENINPFDLKQTIEHEISHLLQAGNKTSLDKELSKLKLIEDDEFGDIPGTYRVGEIGWLDVINSPAYIDEAKDYFRHGSDGKEKLAMVSELRQDLLDRGIIKDLYDKITPEMLQKHFDKYMGKGTGKKSIPLRVYDIMEDEESNFKVLASVLNKLPMLIPAIGTGVAVGVGAQDTGTKSLGQAGAYQFKYGGSVGHKLRKFIN